LSCFLFFVFDCDCFFFLFLGFSTFGLLFQIRSLKVFLVSGGLCLSLSFVFPFLLLFICCCLIYPSVHFFSSSLLLTL
jgi:hypothetical protein